MQSEQNMLIDKEPREAERREQQQHFVVCDTDCRKKETSETLTTSRSRRLNQFLQKEPWWRNAPWTVI